MDFLIMCIKIPEQLIFVFCQDFWLHIVTPKANKQWINLNKSVPNLKLGYIFFLYSVFWCILECSYLVFILDLKCNIKNKNSGIC